MAHVSRGALRNSQPWSTRAPAALPSDKNRALANGGQKALLSAKSAACFGDLLRPNADRGGHTRTESCCSGPWFAKTAIADWRRTAAKGGQNGEEALAELAEENVSNQSSVRGQQSKSVCAPATAGKVVRLGQARALLKMTCASGPNDLRNWQNGVRDQAK